MAMQTYNLTPGRINKLKGEILKHAVPMEVLTRNGRQVKLPKNSGDTYVARRWLPFGASANDANTINRFFANAPGDRAAAYVQAHQVSEGVTPAPDSIVPMDVPIVIQQYSCLYAFTDKAAMLYEDGIPDEMKRQAGERMGLLKEMITYGALKSCTNAYFGGAGTSIATVNGGLTLALIRRIVRNLQANHAKPVTSLINSSANYGTVSVEPGYFVYIHTDLEPDVRDIPGFHSVGDYRADRAVPGEIGEVERFRFIASPDLPSIQDAGAAVGATGLISTSGSNVDVYPVIVTGQDAWSQLVLRGSEAIDPTYIPAGQKTKSDPHGQRGYVGAMWWGAAAMENSGWAAICYVGSKTV